MSTIATATMSTTEIAKKLKKLCAEGKFEEAQTQLFSDDVVSIEPMASHGFAKETRGIEGVRKKSERWNEMVKELHGVEVSDPVIAGQSFALTMRMDTTMKEGGRMDMTELCVYRVKDGKVISEEFFM